MKNLRIHALYLIVIGFLVYQVWSYRRVNALNQDLKLCLDKGSLSSKLQLNRVLIEIERQVSAYANPLNMSFSSKAKEVYKIIEEFSDKIEQLKNQNTKLNDNDLNDLQNKLSNLKQLINVYNSTAQKEIDEKVFTPHLLQNRPFWDNLREASLEEQDIRLSILKNQVVSDGLVILDYYQNQVGGRVIICNFGIGIVVVPKKLNWVEGDNFEAAIFIAEHMQPFTNEVAFFVNGKEYKSHDEVVTYKESNLTAGHKVLKVQVKLKNRLTEQVSDFSKDFEYEVLPKCSQNCQ